MSSALDHARALAETSPAKSEGHAPFSLEAYHAMERRDVALIADELEHGATSKAFVYSFQMDGKTVSGVSVIGARHLVAAYGGVKHRIVGTLDKRAARCTMMTFPYGDTPMAVQIIDRKEWEEVDDWFRVIVEMVDIKTGNSIQVSHEECAMEFRKDKTKFRRPHYTKIAESKAYRNAALALMPQDIVQQFKQAALDARSTIDLTPDLIQDRRDGVLTHATAKGISVDRQAINRLSFAQIDGLVTAVKSSPEDFQRSLEALNVLSRLPEPVDGGTAKRSAPKEPSESQVLSRGKANTRKAAVTNEPEQFEPGASESETIDPSTGEITGGPKAAERPTRPASQPMLGSFGSME